MKRIKFLAFVSVISVACLFASCGAGATSEGSANSTDAAEDVEVIAHEESAKVNDSCAKICDEAARDACSEAQAVECDKGASSQSASDNESPVE